MQKRRRPREPRGLYTANTSRGHERAQHTQPNSSITDSPSYDGWISGSSPCFGGTTACGYPFSTAKIASCSTRLSKKCAATLRKLLQIRNHTMTIEPLVPAGVCEDRIVQGDFCGQGLEK